MTLPSSPDRDIRTRYGEGAPRANYIILGGHQSPGLAIPAGASTPRKWDVQNGYGLSGAYLIYTGDSLEPFGVKICLWTEAQHDEWRTFATAVLRKPARGTRPKALGILHPALNQAPLYITAVVVSNVTQLEQSDDGLWTCVITLIPYRAPMPMLGKPNTTIPAAAEPKPTAQDAGDRAIERILGEIQKETR